MGPLVWKHKPTYRATPVEKKNAAVPKPEQISRFTNSAGSSANKENNVLLIESHFCICPDWSFVLPGDYEQTWQHPGGICSIWTVWSVWGWLGWLPKFCRERSLGALYARSVTGTNSVGDWDISERTRLGNDRRDNMRQRWS